MPTCCLGSLEILTPTQPMEEPGFFTEFCKGSILPGGEIARGHVYGYSAVKRTREGFA